MVSTSRDYTHDTVATGLNYLQAQFNFLLPKNLPWNFDGACCIKKLGILNLAHMTTWMFRSITTLLLFVFRSEQGFWKSTSRKTGRRHEEHVYVTNSSIEAG